VTKRELYDEFKRNPGMFASKNCVELLKGSGFDFGAEKGVIEFIQCRA
jgi:hypothetical protein